MHNAERLLKAHDYKLAMARVDHVLTAKPSGPNARFLKGAILTEAGDSTRAIAVFKKLTQDYPKLLEPYNNLAMIYASKGRYELARDELEKALRTHPSYATADENLGDVYAKLASQAYDKALQIDSSNPTTQDKLALIRKLIGGPRESIDEGRRVEVAVVKPPAARVPVSASGAPKPARRHLATQIAEAKPAAAKPAPHAKHAAPVAATTQATHALSEPTPPAAPGKPSTPAARATPAHKAAPSPGATEGAIRATVAAQARAWSAQNADHYPSFYAKNYGPPHGESRIRWKRIQHTRLSDPRSISVTIDSPHVVLESHGEAKVTFRQLYRTKRLKLSATKTLVLEKSGARWLVRREEVAR